MNTQKMSVQEAVKANLVYLINFYNLKEGRLPLNISSAFFKNELGFRVHKKYIAPLIETNDLKELTGCHVVCGDVIYQIDFDPSSLWFTVS